MSKNHGKNPPPSACPYCGATVGKLSMHLPCEAVPSTEEVLRR